MQTIQLDVRDDYVEKILDFLKLLPENVAKIHNTNSEELSDELLSRINELKTGKVKGLSRDELFDDL